MRTGSRNDEWVGAMSASDIAAKVASGEVSAKDVVEAHIARIEAVDGRLNAVVSRRFDEARAEAALVDAAVARGEKLGPLAGVPITIKEQFNVAGLPTTFGLPKRRNHIAAADGPLVRRLRDAGAVVLGKTNVAQFLFYQEADNPLYGRTSNPWNVKRSSGGGSGGEGAIIAAGGSALGLAADVGGSIRTPAHFCGIHGFRPTSWRLTNLDSPPEMFFPGFNEIALDPGPMARHVADLALAMQVLAAPGLERVDARIPPVPWPDPAAVRIEGMRVAMFDNDGFWSASPALRRATQEAAAALRLRGAVVDHVTPPEPEMAAKVYFSFMMADGFAWAAPQLKGNPLDGRIKMARQIAKIPNRLKPPLAGLLSLLRQRHLAGTIMTSRSMAVKEYWSLAADRNRWRDAFVAMLDSDMGGASAAGGYDAILCPPHALPALFHGGSKLLFDTTSYGIRFNDLGMPAGVVAATRVREGEESDRRFSLDIVERAARKTEKGTVGLPVGVQVAARLWRDDIVLAVMAALEGHFRQLPDYPENPPC